MGLICSENWGSQVFGWTARVRPGKVPVLTLSLVLGVLPPKVAWVIASCEHVYVLKWGKPTVAFCLKV